MKTICLLAILVGVACASDAAANTHTARAITAAIELAKCVDTALKELAAPPVDADAGIALAPGTIVKIVPDGPDAPPVPSQLDAGLGK
jgi:hypothetical protein